MSKSRYCNIEGLKSYLEDIKEDSLLDYIVENNDGYSLSKSFYEKRQQLSKHPSIMCQIATMLAILGEHKEAESVYPISWSNISPAGDKVSNGILQKFIKPYPYK